LWRYPYFNIQPYNSGAIHKNYQRLEGLWVKFLVFPRKLWWLPCMEAKLGQFAKREGVD
jgi:hypothetical protein